MKTLLQRVRRLAADRTKSVDRNAVRLNERTRRDIALDGMAAEYLQDAQLWRQLAA